eukprot:scaffold72067_cov63-Phaeocystis_antarctica.AAC.2
MLDLALGRAATLAVLVITGERVIRRGGQRLPGSGPGVKGQGRATSRDQDLDQALASGPFTHHAHAAPHSAHTQTYHTHAVLHSGPLGRRSSDETQAPRRGRHQQARPRRRSARSLRYPPPRGPRPPGCPPPWATAMSRLRWQGRVGEAWLGSWAEAGLGAGVERAGLPSVLASVHRLRGGQRLVQGPTEPAIIIIILSRPWVRGSPPAEATDAQVAAGAGHSATAALQPTLNLFQHGLPACAPRSW